MAYTCYKQAASTILISNHRAYYGLNGLKSLITRMWAGAQRDGRPAKCSWRPLFNTAKFG